MGIPTEIIARWMAKKPVAGVAFLLDDEIVVTSGPHVGKRAWVVALLEITPHVVYSIELEAGSAAHVPQTSLVGAAARAMPDALSRLQRWFAGRCDGNWEHAEGIKLATLDNPGWSLKVTLQGTGLDHKPFAEVLRDHNERSWLACRVRDGLFEAFGGPHMLGSMIDVFLEWAEADSDGTA